MLRQPKIRHPHPPAPVYVIARNCSASREVKTGGQKVSPSLSRMQTQTQAMHAFQCEIESAYVEADCFREGRPISVPASTLLSQLL